MAAVVKVKTENTVPDAVVKRAVGYKYTNGNHQLTVPLLSELDKETDSCVVDVDNTAVHKQTLIPQDGATMTNVAENFEDGEVIGIVTLEDVFEELLQAGWPFCLLLLGDVSNLTFICCYERGNC